MVHRGTNLIIGILWHDSFWPANQPASQQPASQPATSQPSCSQPAGQPASQPESQLEIKFVFPISCRILCACVLPLVFDARNLQLSKCEHVCAGCTGDSQSSLRVPCSRVWSYGYSDGRESNRFPKTFIQASIYSCAFRASAC